METSNTMNKQDMNAMYTESRGRSEYANSIRVVTEKRDITYYTMMTQRNFSKLVDAVSAGTTDFISIKDIYDDTVLINCANADTIEFTTNAIELNDVDKFNTKTDKTPLDVCRDFLNPFQNKDEFKELCC